MFGLSNSLIVELGDAKLEFKSPHEFEFALAGRVSVPASKIAKLAVQPDEALVREAQAIRAVEKRFDKALSGSLEDVTSISPFLKEIDLSLISQDHDWRAIVSALNGTDEPHEEFKQIALVKYVQYLASRQEVIRALFAAREAARKARGEAASEVFAPEDDPNMRETAIFDLTAYADADRKAGVEFARLPKGEVVELALERDQRVELMLAKHRCRIEWGDGLTFVDDAGRSSRLRRGKNIVGRDASSDITVNPSYRDVSRKHLIVETDGESTIRLTDISSHGTSIHPDYLDSTSV